MAMQLRVIIAGILTVFGIAERFVLETDLAFCGDGEGFDAVTECWLFFGVT